MYMHMTASVLIQDKWMWVFWRSYGRSSWNISLVDGTLIWTLPFSSLSTTEASQALYDRPMYQTVCSWCKGSTLGFDEHPTPSLRSENGPWKIMISCLQRQFNCWQIYNLVCILFCICCINYTGREEEISSVRIEDWEINSTQFCILLNLPKNEVHVPTMYPLSSIS